MINGYWTPRDVLKVRAAAAQPSWPVSQLDEATRAVPQRARVAYGRAGLFVTYLAGRFGNGLVRAIVSDPFVGMRAVNDALQRRGEGTTAAQAFADWGVAAYLDQPGRYGYGPLRHRLHTALHLASRPVRTYPYDTSSCCSAGSVLQPWSQGYVQFGSSTMGTLTVSVEDQQCSMLAALVLQDSTGLFATRVQWLRIDGRGKEITSARGFGDDYDRALLVMNGVGPDITTGSRPSAGPRVRAWMDHAEQARGTLVDASLRQ
jgi:hypothetical protein